ncbi:hypothetical protein ACFL96_16185 [Thermoproteota archaeon]
MKFNLITRNHNKGVSVIISSSMMLAAVAVMGASLLIFANSSFNQQLETSSELFQEGGDAVKENLVVEDVWFDANSTRYVNITLRNIGSIVINITQVSLNSTVIWNESLILNIEADETVYTVYPWSDGVYTVEVLTERENIAIELWEAKE